MNKHLSIAFILGISIGDPSFAQSPLTLDVTSKPSGALSQSQTNKLWNAYKTAKECFEHPTYGQGKGYKLSLQNVSSFQKNSWRDPYQPKSPINGKNSVSTLTPAPLVAVKLDERYGERNALVDRSAKWFRAASTALRKGATPESKKIIRETLVAWASSNALSKGIHVSWGSKPVDWQVITLINAILTTTASMATDFTNEERTIVGPWLNQLVKEVAASYWKDRQDNKTYLVSYTTLVWALMVSDQKAAQNSVEVVKLAVHDMRPDGSFPIDSQRGGMGLQYAANSLGYLIMISSLVKVNTGQDIFSYKAKDRTLHDAVDFIVKAIESPSKTNKLYAIKCSSGGDRWGSIEAPSTHFISESSYLSVYSTLNPQSPHSAFIKAKYKDGTSSGAEVFGVAPGYLVR